MTNIYYLVADIHSIGGVSMFGFKGKRDSLDNVQSRAQGFTSLDRIEIMSILEMFERYTKQYGCSSSTVRKFRKEIDSLVKQRAVNQKNRDYVYKILGMVRTNQIKWNITLDRLQNLNGTMAYIESDPHGKRLIAVYEEQERCQVLPIIKTLYHESYLKFKLRYKMAKTTGADVLSDDELKANRYRLNHQ